VFADPAARQTLEAITHPRIAERFRAEQRRAQRDGVPVLVYEAALLVETGAYRAVQELVAVIADPELQARRLRERDGLDRAAARRRLAAQVPVQQKVAVADHVIKNDGSLSELERQVQQLWERWEETIHEPHR
jgi:dephospho-CoA kinase